MTPDQLQSWVRGSFGEALSGTPPDALITRSAWADLVHHGGLSWEQAGVEPQPPSEPGEDAVIRVSGRPALDPWEILRRLRDASGDGALRLMWVGRYELRIEASEEGTRALVALGEAGLSELIQADVDAMRAGHLGFMGVVPVVVIGAAAMLGLTIWLINVLVG
jgi:hypothetical protein